MPTSISSPIAVLGTGAWGTAVAMVLARNGQTCRLWGFDPVEVQEILDNNCNKRFLPGIPLPKNLIVTNDLAVALTDVHDIMIIVPSPAFRETLQRLIPYQSSNWRIAWGTKGLDPKSGNLLQTVIAEVFADSFPTAVMGGPSFAKEVAQGLPTAVTIASKQADFSHALAKRLGNPAFRVYNSNDMIGVQLGGVIKNVLAIATGISDGLGYGSNARCALITRGLAEMTRIGVAMGGQRETFVGLAGLGDLVLTCTDDQSRNRRFGLALGRGVAKQTAEKEVGQIVEGAHNTTEVLQLARQYKVDMPITQQIYKILHENMPPRDAVTALFARESKDEY